jgi:hypothetical protein
MRGPPNRAKLLKHAPSGDYHGVGWFFIHEALFA